MDLNEKGAEFTDDDIRDEVVTMMIGVSTYSHKGVNFKWATLN